MYVYDETYMKIISVIGLIDFLHNKGETLNGISHCYGNLKLDLLRYSIQWI